MAHIRRTMNNKILLVGVHLDPDPTFYLSGGGKQAQAGNKSIKKHTADLDAKLKPDPNSDILIVAMDLLGVETAQDLYSLSFVIFFDAGMRDSNDYIQRSLDAIKNYRQPGDQIMLVGLLPNNALTVEEANNQINPILAQQFKSLVTIQYDNKLTIDTVITSCLQNLKQFIQQENKQDLWQNEAKFIESLNNTNVGRLFASIFRNRDARITGIEDLVHEDKSENAGRFTKVENLIKTYLDYLQKSNDASYKTPRVEALLIASREGLAKFAFTLGTEEDFISAKRNTFDPRTPTGQKLIADIHAVFPELVTNMNYIRGKSEGECQSKLNNIYSLLEIYGANIDINLTRAKEAKDDATGAMLVEIAVQLRFMATLFTGMNPKSATERLSDFAALFDIDFIALIKSASVNQNRFSLFKSEPADVLIKGVYSIVPDLDEIRMLRADVKSIKP